MGILAALGWDASWEAEVTEAERAALRPGRAVEDRGPRLLVRFEDGDALVTVPGRLRAAGEVPVVGDFVLATRDPEAVLARVLPRRARLARGAAGKRSDEQVLAANVDLVLAVEAMDGGVKPHWIERALAAIHGSGAAPALVLSKMDLLDLPEDREAVLEEARAAAGAAPVLAVSAVTGEGLDDLRALLAPGRTAVFLGASGAGKSTLVNALVGSEAQATAAVRAKDARGRHRTTGRRLFLLDGGGAVVDGPGIRELKLADAAGLDAAFEDVAALAASCRFRDCSHGDEPGCAVRAAVEAGALDEGRLESLRALAAEARAAEDRRSGAAKRQERALSRAIRRYFADHDGE
jgi:ribosome biogenesis GTPase